MSSAFYHGISRDFLIMTDAHKILVYRGKSPFNNNTKGMAIIP